MEETQHLPADAPPRERRSTDFVDAAGAPRGSSPPGGGPPELGLLSALFLSLSGFLLISAQFG